MNPRSFSSWFLLLFLSIGLCLFISCKETVTRATGETIPSAVAEKMEKPTPTLVEGVDYFLPKIDLNNWKVTLPIGKPNEIKPPEILDYANVDALEDFMYTDSTDGSIVFYTHPGASTRNSSYSRTELREQMVPGTVSYTHLTLPTILLV